MATPILFDLRHHYPETKMAVMCQSNVAPLLQHDPNIDEIFSFHKPSGWLRRMEHRNIIAPLQKGKYEFGILLTNSFSSAWWFWRGGVRERVGYKGNCRDWLLTHALPFPIEKERQHLVVTYKNLLTPLGVPLSDTLPKLYVTEQEQKEAQERLRKHRIGCDKIIVGINPGAAFGSAKCWLPERFREVAERLLRDDSVSILFFGDGHGAPLVDDICSGLPERVVNLAGKTSLREMMALINACSVFLTNDSGPMHVAAAFQKPLVALFGSTNSVTTGPYGGGSVIHKHVSCSPCYLRECPIDFRCMKEITVNEVMQQLSYWLEKEKEKRCLIAKP